MVRINSRLENEVELSGDKNAAKVVPETQFFSVFRWKTPNNFFPSQALGWADGGILTPRHRRPSVINAGHVGRKTVKVNWRVKFVEDKNIRKVSKNFGNNENQKK